MSDRKLAKAVQTLFRQVARLSRNLSRSLIAWLLRAALVANRRTRPVAGFVLPTTVLLILVVSLTAGALSYRAFNTSTRTINETQNRVIYNAGTPAIDRARAKIEFLFDSTKDTRYPGGVPSSDYLVSMLLNDGNTTINGQKAGQLLLGGNDPYTLPDEKTWGAGAGSATGRLDSNGDGTPDNAWGFRADTDGDGTTDATIVYSIALTIPPNTGTTQGWQRLIALNDKAKAEGRPGGSDPRSVVPYARTGPLNNSPSAAGCAGSSSASSVESGWYPDTSNTAVLRRNFQVDAFVLPDSATKPGSPANFATLEFQQDRVLNRGNKWGAWFRNDLEIFPGPPFQWNGAMHTEGNLIVGSGSNNFSAYLISSPRSCLWYESSSEITITDVSPTASKPDDFLGQLVSGRVGPDSNSDQSLVYIWSNNFTTASKVTLSTSTASVSSGTVPSNVAIDPKKIQTTNGYAANGGTNNRGYTNAAFKGSTLNKRIFNRTETAPYVDDTYRADDRYGPKQKYSDQVQIPSGKKIGELMASGDNVSTDPGTTTTSPNPVLTAQDDPNAKPGDTPNLGLDGYWERRARFQGLRVLVGQRLELGNPFGWVAPQDRHNGTAQDLASTTLVSGNSDLRDLRTAITNPTTRAYAEVPIPADLNLIDPDTSDNEGDPLYPPHSTTIKHEARQRRALRDNLSAVQSTAVYHAAVDKDYPVACMASVVHPGSPLTLQQSLNFVPTVFVDSTAAANPENNAAPSTIDTALMTDFFNGRGTDGWEFDAPGGNKADFIAGLAADRPLRIALNNLAQFAGDHDVSTGKTGAFPPTQEAGQIHPDPEFAMWGNFSNLRRTLSQLDAVGYDNLSIADKTYLHTAACTLGMLAYNVDRVQRFDPTNYKNDITRNSVATVVQQLALDLYGLMNGVVNEPSDFEVLPKGRLATYDYNPNGSPVPTAYTPRDYDRVPAEAYLGKLREYYAASNPNSNPSNDPRYRLAELILTNFQVRRDRTFGFRPSPAANTWNYNPYVANVGNGLSLWSSACDPNIFALNADSSSRKTGSAGTIENKPDVTIYTNRLRLALSRLCGTVIPPGAVRDYPGDTGFPARTGTATPTAITNLKYIPTIGGNYPTGLTAKSGSTAFAYAPPAPLSSLDDPTNPYIAGSSKNDNGYPYLAASVAPKWPSLYYLFPEVAHDHDGDVTDVGSFSGMGMLGSGAGPDGKGTDNKKDNLGTPGVANWEDDVDHRQPTGTLKVPSDAGTGSALAAAFQPWAEPYITDSYIKTVNASVTYNPIDTLTPTFVPTGRDIDTGYSVPNLSFQDPKNGSTLTYTYKTFGNPLADLPVSAIALKPRKLPSGFNNPFSITGNDTWQLPVSPLASATVVPQNTPPNRITAPNSTNVTGVTAVIPFLDRALFNGREWLPSRVTDIDLGMLRRVKVSDTVTILPVADPKDVWLPVSGIVYAFREDAVREDTINRPAGGTYTNVTDPTSPTDPPITPGTNVSVKQVDGVADPDRRPYGFRLRNGAQLKRHASTGVAPQDNIRGLSFFTDNPLYIMGFYNLHQVGSADATKEDVGDPTDSTYQTNNFIEEFTPKLPSNRAYTDTEFYGRTDRDNAFADRDLDRWRPSELLADAITVLSNTFCDGSVLDTFMTAGTGNNATLKANTYDGRNQTDSGFNFPTGFYPYRVSAGNQGGASVYTTTSSALYGPGCVNDGATSFLNQNRPKNDLPSSNWAWLRENPYDIFSPIKISRNGDGMTIQSQVNSRLTIPPGEIPLQAKPLVPLPYTTSAPINGAYYAVTDARALQAPQNTRVNTIMVSGLIPSRQYQSYGGLHNFPRFLENWDAGPKYFLWFAGSFLQLNFSNYATAPFDQQTWEPTDKATKNNEKIPYYGAPQRLWGYDVALQKSPAGPAAARFVTATKDRNEFYQEPAANDPYIRNLCLALPNTLFPDAKCPS